MEVSLQPLDWVGTEAVIVFSDIFVPVTGMGVGLDFVPGPVVAEPIRRPRASSPRWHKLERVRWTSPHFGRRDLTCPWPVVWWFASGVAR